jgi:Domain of unknown function (DUF5071)
MRLNKFPTTFSRMASSSSSSSRLPPFHTLLPKDKHDIPTVQHLTTLKPPELAPLIPELLTWLQDWNWPIFRSVQDLVLLHPDLAVESIRAVLTGDDAAWKAHCLQTLLKMPIEQQLSLKGEVERIARWPTAGELEEEAEIEARSILHLVGSGKIIGRLVVDRLGLTVSIG